MGREALLESLRTLASDGLAGKGALVVLRGEPGSGKTRTCEEALLAAERRGWNVLVGHCLEDAGAPPLWPWVEILRGLGARDPDFGARATRHHPLLGDLAQLRDPTRATAATGSTPVVDAGERFRLLEGLTALLLEESRSHPLALLLEDVHVSDTMSLRALESVQRRVGEGRLLVLATARSHAFDDEGTHAALLADLASRTASFELSGLSQPEIQRLVELETGHPADPRLAARLFDRTGGNAFLLVQLARVIGEGGSVDDLPRSLRGALRHRMLPLSQSHREVLSVASVLGHGFDAGRVARVGKLDEDTVEQALEAGLAHRLLARTSEDRASFSHALVRDHLYAELGPRERRELHRAAAHALSREAEEPVDAVLHHLERADGDAPSEATLEYRIRAARRATEHLAWEDAARLLASTLEVLEARGGAEARRAELWIELGAARARSADAGLAPEAFARAEELAARASRPDIRARAVVGAAWDVRSGTARQTSDPHRTERIERALDALPDGETDAAGARARLLMLLAMELYWNGELDRVRQLADEALAMARESRDARLLADCLLGFVNSCWMPDNLPERLALCDETIALGDQLGEPSLTILGHHFRAVARLESSDTVGADADRARVRGLSEELRYPLLAHHSDNAETIRLIAAGRYDEAEALSRRSLETGQQLGAPHTPALHGSHMLMLLALRGRASSAVGPLRALASQSDLAYAHASLAWLLCVAGEPEAARAELHALGDDGLDAIRPDFFALGCLAHLAEAAAHLGEGALASRIYERLEAYRGRSVVVGYATAHLGSVDRHLGALCHALGREEDARAHFEAAVGIERSSGNLTHLVFALEGLAALLAPDPRTAARAEALRAEAAAARARVGLVMPTLPVAAPAGRSIRSDDDDRAYAVWCRRGDGWQVEFAGRQTSLPDARGPAYLAELLARPGQEIHVLDLLARVAPEGERPESGGGMEVLDARARAEYRARIESLRDELEEARERRDTGHETRAREELETIEDALAGALGLGGRARRTGDAVERARKAVYNRVRDTLRRLEDELPELALHLRNGIKTGRTCVYTPERPIHWTTEG